MGHIKSVYKTINCFSTYTQKVLEGEFPESITQNKEGDLYIFAHQLSKMSMVLRENIEKLKREKSILKDTITNISHQLKTPISSLFMFNEIQRNNENMNPQERKEFNEMSLIQLERMDRLTQKLLKLAKLDAKIVEFKLDKKPIYETFYRVINEASVMAQRKNIIIKVVGNKEVLLPHDPEWTSEAFGNILQNAIEHSLARGEILIDWTQSPLATEISIKDSGGGINPKEINKIFQRFYKGEDNKNPASTGIGLALSREIIEAQGGSIVVKSELGVGTEFVITFVNILI